METFLNMSVKNRNLTEICEGPLGFSLRLWRRPASVNTLVEVDLLDEPQRCYRSCGVEVAVMLVSLQV
jgi:hypothetical protein